MEKEHSMQYPVLTQILPISATSLAVKRVGILETAAEVEFSVGFDNVQRLGLHRMDGTPTATSLR